MLKKLLLTFSFFLIFILNILPSNADLQIPNNLISPNAKDRNFKKIAGVVFFIICIFSNPFYKDTYNLIFIKKSGSLLLK